MYIYAEVALAHKCGETCLIIDSSLYSYIPYLVPNCKSSYNGVSPQIHFMR